MKYTPSLIDFSLIGEKIDIYGIILHRRDFGKKKFIIITDGIKKLQIVYEGKEKFRRGMVIKAYGVLKEEPKAINGIELKAEKIEILSKPEEEVMDEWSILRMHKNKKIKIRPITMRIPEIMRVFKFYADVVNYLREFCRKEDLLEIFTPKIVRLGTESGSEVFSILYFDKDAYLAQSPQLYKQMLMASGIIGVFEVGSYYRAEKSFSKRHLTEFRGFDVELNYIEDYNEILEFIENLISYVFEKLNLEKPKFAKITFEEAKELLKEHEIIIEDDLTTEAEKTLGKIFSEKSYDFVFVTEFPYSSRPFYTMKKEDDPKYTYSFDLLFKGLEIISGSKREHRYEILKNQILEKNVNPERLESYLNIFKLGIPPHGGFGMGIDRFVKQLLDLEDIRDAVLFPRDPDTLEP